MMMMDLSWLVRIQLPSTGNNQSISSGEAAGICFIFVPRPIARTTESSKIMR